jgi:hypothetical protein
MTDPAPGRHRRRLDTRDGERQPKAGCLITGAVLGIIVGATFAFYGLPPILRSIYGEQAVPPGETYTGNAKQIGVLAVERDPATGITSITLRARTNMTWAPDLADIRLEVAGQDDWLEPLPPDPAIPGTEPDFPLGRERDLLLRYEIPPGIDGTPVALHLADPRIRFDFDP